MTDFPLIWDKKIQIFGLQPPPTPCEKGPFHPPPYPATALLPLWYQAFLTVTIIFLQICHVVRRGWMVKAIACWTEGSRFKSHHAPEVGHHPLLAQWKFGWQKCSPTRKKARVCAVTSMWLVHIKEHVWTVGTCPTTILLIIGGAIRQMQKHCAFSPGWCAEAEMWIQLPCHLYAPQRVDLGGGGSFS